jgi:hypothetical protein
LEILRKFIFLLAILFFSLFFWAARAAHGQAAGNALPYPDGYDTVSAGASAAAGQGDFPVSPYFPRLDFYNMKSGGSLIMLEKFRTYQQTTEWSCGSATALMVLRHFGDDRYDELAIAEMMGSNPLPADGKPQPGVLYGTTAAGMLKFFQAAGYRVSSSLASKGENGATFSDPADFRSWLLAQLAGNTPIMVDWLDWGGHWQAIIGYDTMGTETVYDDVLILADPYDVGDQSQDGYYVFSAFRFYYMWQDTSFQPAGRQAQQWVAAVPQGR